MHDGPFPIGGDCDTCGARKSVFRMDCTHTSCPTCGLRCPGCDKYVRTTLTRTGNTYNGTLVKAAAAFAVDEAAAVAGRADELSDSHMVDRDDAADEEAVDVARGHAGDGEASNDPAQPACEPPAVVADDTDADMYVLPVLMPHERAQKIASLESARSWLGVWVIVVDDFR